MRWPDAADRSGAVAYTPDSGRVLAAGNDSVVRLWDAATGDALGDPVAATAGASAAPQDKGAAIFRRCGPCHTVTADGGNRAGPTLHGIFGRKAGTLEGYPYSPALRDSDIVWTAETIGDLFTQGPDVVTPGSKMPLQKLVRQEDREALIEYLRRVTSP
jgi:cytochrome c